MRYNGDMGYFETNLILVNKSNQMNMYIHLVLVKETEHI